jgi:NAD-dependent dihydropyrimidine dehydrogenase PreA subunit/uncharacterized membrane protein YgcG
MNKTLVNYWVDLVTGTAFILCAVTGIVLLFPGIVHVAAGAAPTILLTPAVWWHKVHDWTGVAMVAGTALHLALHAKWITVMTRKVFGAPAAAGPARAARQDRAAQPAFVAAAAPQMAAGGTAESRSAADADAAAAASLTRLETLCAERQREREQRISRRRFLAGAAAVGTGVLLAGVGLVGKDAVSSASARLRDDGWTGGGQGQSGAGTSGGGTSDGSGSSAQNGSSRGSTTTTTVSVNQSACVACGRCLQVCPRGVFAWSSSGRAEASSPDACIRCGRCLQVCPAGAITVSA